LTIPNFINEGVIQNVKRIETRDILTSYKPPALIQTYICLEYKSKKLAKKHYQGLGEFTFKGKSLSILQ